jgi:hypothetical protein
MWENYSKLFILKGYLIGRKTRLSTALILGLAHFFNCRCTLVGKHDNSRLAVLLEINPLTRM